MIHETAYAVAMRGDEDSTRREKDAMRRALDNLDEAGFIIAPKDEVVVILDAGADHPDLPVPRLQLRWSSPSRCHYEMVLGLKEFDIRREVEGRGNLRSRFMAVTLGGTMVGGGSGPLDTDEHGVTTVIKPYRDGKHILWDAKQLNLPAYAIWGEWVTKLDPDKQ